MGPLETLLIVGGIILGNELIISLLRSHYLSNRKMAHRRNKHETKENYEAFAPDKKRTQ